MAEKTSPPQFESWGRYPSLPAEIVSLAWASEFPSSKIAVTKMLPVGLGRSYGDVCLLQGGTLLKASPLDRFLAFDPQTGVLRCEAGVTFAEILEVCIPKGWFVPVTPGTKYVTVGGAIANDVHGKNHHVAGTLGCHILRFELVRSDGTRIECSPDKNQDWYCATIAGIGLTGLITWADIQMRPIVSPKLNYEGIQFQGMDEFMQLSEAAVQNEYAVAWIDCASRGRDFFRGIFMQASHSEEPATLIAETKNKFNVPCPLPGFFLNRHSVRVFNALYYRKQLRSRVKRVISYEPFFYPLDSVLNWNRIYGRKGALQLQCVLPGERGKLGILTLLREITAAGMASPLAVLKTFGNVPSPGMMSFPQPGVTLAVDFPIRGEETFRLYERLVKITAEYGGRIYPAKDACMSAAHFRHFYPQWQQFARYIDLGFHSAFWQRVTANA